jgi:hypothetical protein
MAGYAGARHLRASAVALVEARIRATRWRGPGGLQSAYGLPSICVKHVDAIDVDRRVWTCQKNQLLSLNALRRPANRWMGFGHGLYFEAELVGKA